MSHCPVRTLLSVRMFSHVTLPSHGSWVLIYACSGPSHWLQNHSKPLSSWLSSSFIDKMTMAASLQ